MAGPGQPKTGGREAGSKNKTTVAVKEALIKAFDEMGGVESLVEWGVEHPHLFYPLWVKLLPQEVKADVTVRESLAEALAEARARRRATLPN